MILICAQVSPFRHRLPQTIRMIWDKLFFGHLGDGRLDVFDFLPLAFSLLAALVIFTQLLPSAFDFSNLNFGLPFNLNKNVLILGKEAAGRRGYRYYFNIDSKIVKSITVKAGEHEYVKHSIMLNIPLCYVAQNNSKQQ